MLYFAPWKIWTIVLICLAGLAFSAPNFFGRDTADRLPIWLPHNQLNLGLDLQGGSHLLIEVDTASVINERLESLVEAVRTALRGTKPSIRYRGLGVDGDRVTVRITKSEDAETAMARLQGLAVPLSPNPLAGLAGGGLDLIVEAVEGGVITLSMTEESVQARIASAVTQSIEIVRRRVDEYGVAEPSIQRQGTERILVQLPGIDDPDRIKELLKTTAKMVFRLVDENADPLAARAPPGSEILYEEDFPGEFQPIVVRKRVEVSGENLTDAQPTYDQGRPVVSFRFDATGAKRFADTTSKNVGRRFAIVLDNKVVSAPVIREPILQGNGVISGSFTAQEANDLALLLRAGALPAPLQYLEERTVGPDLGADSIRAGKIACTIGFLLVIIFMVAAYGLFGLAADVALITNIFLIIGTLSAMQATLTLPGIAGIVLTIGMAVDANVLIFERIREEIRAGKSPFNAVESGYKRAFITIVDANVTTFIAAAILFAFGSGPVQGFAVTLGIGIISSMFTATVLTRLLVSLWLRRRRPMALAL